MKALAAVFLSGVVFALGLGVSGMTDADKVIAFLNLAGAWDPSLAFVMAGAIAVHLGLLRLINQRPGPLFGEEFHIPARGDVDGRLLGGIVEPFERQGRRYRSKDKKQDWGSCLRGVCADRRG